VSLASFRKDTVLTPGRIIARGSVDVQNPNFDGKLWNDAIDQNFMPNFTFQTTAIEPGTFYPYTFEMNVMEYTVLKGHKLVLLIFGADPEYTIRPMTASAATGFKVEIGPDTYLSLPLVEKIPPLAQGSFDDGGATSPPGETYLLEPEDQDCSGVMTAEVTPTEAGETGQEEAADAVADFAENWASDVEQAGPAIEVKLPKDEPTVVTLANLPEDLDPADVTVMAILNDDGTLTPVPTRIIGGKIVVILLEDAILVPLAVSATFSDLAHVSDAVKNEILKAASLAIVEGFPGGEFRPSEQVTVQQAVAMFLRAAGIKVDYATAMETGVEYKFIAEGMTAGAPMTRIQAAQLIVNALVYFGHTCALTDEEIDGYLAPFPDVDELSAAERKALASCVMHGIFKGHTDGTMRPGEVLNRSQMASLAIRVQDVLIAG